MTEKQLQEIKVARDKIDYSIKSIAEIIRLIATGREQSFKIKKYLVDNFNTLTNARDKLNKQIQIAETPAEITLSQQFAAIHIANDIYDFCEKMKLKNIKFHIEAELNGETVLIEKN